MNGQSNLRSATALVQCSRTWKSRAVTPPAVSRHITYDQVSLIVHCNQRCPACHATTFRVISKSHDSSPLLKCTAQVAALAPATSSPPLPPPPCSSGPGRCNDAGD